MKNRRFLLLSLVAILLAAVAPAQTEVLRLRGALKDELSLKKLDAVQIAIYQNGSQFDVIDAGTSGKIQVDVPLGYIYEFKFSRQGYVPKILRFDTRNIPAEDRSGGFQSDVNLNLFPMIEGFNLDIMKEPIGMASFNDQENNISFDFKYTERMQTKIKAEQDRVAKLGSEDEALKKEYDKLMADGDKKMIEKSYQDAMAKYEAASKLFPQDQPAKTKYAEAKAKYDEMMAARKKEEDYKRLITEGDNYFAQKKWSEARKSFTEASNLKKEERYPKEKLAEIGKMLDQEALRKEYDALVAEADAKYTNKDYAVSIEKYRAALAVLSNESYPKDQIAKAQSALDAMLADEAKRKQLQQRYDDLVKLGDKNLSEKKYDTALSNFKEAGQLKSEERYPKDKIAEIERILQELRNKEQADAAAARDDAERQRLENEYNKHVIAADRFYVDSREKDVAMLESAKSEYQLALDIKPAEKYPAARMKAIDDLIARIRDEEAAMARDNDARNAERLRQEEELRRQREEAERMAAEQRRALEEEEERKRKEREAALAAEEEARRNRAAFLKVDNSEEQAVDAYYREARRIEEEAKTKAMEERKQAYADQQTAQSNRAEDGRKERLDNINSQKDKMDNIYRTGDSWQARQVLEMAESKEQDDKKRKENEQQARSRTERAAQENEELKQEQAALRENDRYRQQSTERIHSEQQTYRETEELNRSKGDARVAANTAAVERRKEDLVNMARVGEQVRQANEQTATEKKEDAAARQRDVRSAAEVRLNSTSGNIEQEKKRAANIGDGKENLQEDEIMDINRQKQSAALLTSESDQESARRRYEAREQLNNLNPGRAKTDDEYMVMPGTEELPEGVTETSYEETKPSRKIIERVVKRGNKVDTYRKVVSKTGIYYFKNDRSITEEMWVRETLRAGE